MRSQSANEQDVHDATVALKGLLGLGSSGNGDINSGNLISPINRDVAISTTPNPDAVASTTPTTNDESNAHGKMNEKMEENGANQNKSKKKKPNKKKKPPATTSAVGASINTTTTTPPSANTRSQEKNQKSNGKNGNSNSKTSETPSNSHQKNQNNANIKSNPNVPKNNSTSKKQNKQENENFAWSAFQSSPDPTKLPIPSFLSPTAAPTPNNTTESSNHKDNRNDWNGNGDDSTDSKTKSTSVTVSDSGAEFHPDHPIMTSSNIDAVSSPQRNDQVQSIADSENDIARNDRNAKEHGLPVAVTPLITTPDNPLEVTGVNVAAALAASQPTNSVPRTGATAVTPPFTTPPNHIINNNNNSTMTYSMRPSMYPNNFGPPPPQNHAPPYHRFPMPQPQHAPYPNITPSHLTNPYPQLPPGQPQSHVPHNPYASPPGYVTIQVQVPPNLIMPGRTMIVPSPAGYPVQIAVPDGVLPGMIIPVHVPIGLPLHMMPPPSQQQQQQPMRQALPSQLSQPPPGPYVNRN